MAGITIWNFYFRLFAGSIKAPQVIEFLKHLQQHIGGRLTVIWDGLPAHRSRPVREYVDRQQGGIHLERLPAYAPELNPKENLWDEIREKLFKNHALKSMDDVNVKLDEAALYIERNPTLVKSITSFPYIAKSY